MDKNRVMEAMEHIDPALVEGADVERRTRVRRRWAQPAIIAACLCLVLAGTALAVELGGVSVSDFIEGNTEDWDGKDCDFVAYDYAVKGIKRIREDSLDPGVMEFIKEKQTRENSYKVVKGVSTRERAEEFLGLELRDNPVLDEMPTIGVSCYEGDQWAEDESQLRRKTTATSVELTGGLCGLQLIDVEMHYQTLHSPWRVDHEDGSWSTGYNFMVVHVKAHIYTDVNDSSIEEDGISTSVKNMVLQDGGLDIAAGEQLTYVSPGGLEAVIVSTHFTGGPGYDGEPIDDYNYTAYFVLDGIFYEVLCIYDDRDVCLETMYEILDAYGEVEEQEADQSWISSWGTAR